MVDFWNSVTSEFVISFDQARQSRQSEPCREILTASCQQSLMNRRIPLSVSTKQEHPVIGPHWTTGFSYTGYNILLNLQCKARQLPKWK